MEKVSVLIVDTNYRRENMAEEKIKGRRPDITGYVGEYKVALWLSDDFLICNKKLNKR